MGTTAPKRKKRRLKKSARRTIAALLMVTALIIAVIPVQDVQADTPSSDLNLPTGLDYFDETQWIAGLDVPNVSGNSIDGYLVDANGNCVTDSFYDLPIPLYRISVESPYVQSGAALTGYNTDALYNIQGGVLPLSESVGYESTANSIQQRVKYTYEKVVSENSLTIEKEVVLNAKGEIIEGENSVPDGYTYVKEKDEILSPFRCNSIAIITCIADSALEGKTNFEEIHIPTYIKRIGNKAFKGCSVKTAVFENSLQFIGNQAFAECGNLNSIQFVQPSSCTVIGAAAFANDVKLTSFEFPHCIVTTGNGLFYGCSNLTDVQMTTAANNNAVTQYNDMGDYTFMNCISLSEITLCPYLGKMGKGTFTGCEYLLRATMPSERTITYPKDTFWNCGSLVYVQVMNRSSTFEDAQEFNSIPVEQSFYIWGPDPTTTSAAIYNYAADLDANYTYYYIDSNNEEHYEKTLNGFKFTIDNTGKINGFEVTNAVTMNSTLDIPDVIGPYNVTTIGERCFDKNKNGIQKVSVVNIPSTILGAGVEAFSGMPNLEEVNIETTGIQLDTDCFKNCPKLKEVNFTQVSIPAGDTSIGTGCFSGCKELELVSFRKDDFMQGEIYDVNVTFIGDNAFKLDSANGDVLTMKGKIEADYLPFTYATNPNTKVNSSVEPYIKYVSGNPTNLECMYDPALNDGNGAVSLLTYPSMDTKVGTVSGQDFTVDMINQRVSPITDPISQVQNDIINSTRTIVLPAVITSIENAQKGTEDYFRAAPDGPSTITLLNVSKLPTKTSSGSLSANSGAFAYNVEDLEVVNFGADITDIGTLPFYDATSVMSVNFSDTEVSPGTIDNKYYWCDKSIIYSSYVDDQGEEVITLEEVLPSRGKLGGTDIKITADETQSITKIADKAFQNCDYIHSVDFSTASNLTAIPVDCFYDCDELDEVFLPSSVNDIGARAFARCDDYIEVTIPAKEVYIHDTAFNEDDFVTLYSYDNSAASRFARDHTNVTFMPIPDNFVVTFSDYDGTILSTQTVARDGDAVPPANPVRAGYTFVGWRPNYTAITSDRTCIAQYTMNSTTGSTTSSTGTTSGTGTTSSTGTTSTTSRTSTTARTSSSGRSTSSSSSSTSSSSTSSSSSSSSMLTTTIISTTVVRNNTGRGGTTGSNTGNNSGNTGGTKVIANTAGISDIGKISATVNGSTDSYVIKITDSAEATAAVEQALLAEYGTLDPLRYLPMDISLYDSTGTTKISPLPEGVSVSVTLPIPDDLAIYGGNAKPANAEGGVLSKMNPRFTVINGVPCMTFTATHFSPYVIYVDTANLSTDGSQDATPVTGDPIHPKWFLVIGLAAIAVVLFLKRDSEDRLKMA